MAIFALLQSLSCCIYDQIIQIEYNNTQTINLIIKKIALSKIKLRHVNIYNH
jgi:hypothetical protein